MIFIGTDIESVQRIQNLLDKKPRILKKFFFGSEWEYAIQKASMVQTLTGIWCAKEAVIKALSPKINISVQDIEIKRTDNGMPYVVVHPLCLDDSITVSVSISHCKEYAVASVIVNFKTL